MRHFFVSLFCLISLIIFSACSGKAEAAVASTSTVDGIAPETGLTDVAQPVVAVVNRSPIPLNVFEDRLAQMQAASIGQTARSDVQMQEAVFEGLVDQIIIEQASAQRGVLISDELLDQTISDMRVRYTPDQFVAWMSLNGFTDADLRGQLRAQLMAAQLFEKIANDAPTMAEQVHARHILLKDQAQAQSVLTQLQDGADFVVMAQLVSEDASSQRYGGDLGWFPRGVNSLPREVESAIFSLEPAQLSPVIASPDGFHIIRIEAKDTNRPLTPQQWQTFRANYFKDWLAQQRASADIQRFEIDLYP